jgi:hypothetical protein
MFALERISDAVCYFELFRVWPESAGTLSSTAISGARSLDDTDSA